MKKIFEKVSIKIIIVLILCLLLTNVCSNISFAYDWSAKLDETSKAKGSDNVIKPVTGLAGTVVTVVRVICTGVAVIMLIVLGIKYMVSAPSDRASIMKHAWVYLVGALIMFASSAIISLIAGFASSIGSNGS